jgi:arsenate reductase
VDPSKLQGSEEEIAVAFKHTIDEIKLRVEQLLNLDVHMQDSAAFEAALAQLIAQ